MNRWIYRYVQLGMNLVLTVFLMLVIATAIYWFQYQNDSFEQWLTYWTVTSTKDKFESEQISFFSFNKSKQKTDIEWFDVIKCDYDDPSKTDEVFSYRSFASQYFANKNISKEEIKLIIENPAALREYAKKKSMNAWTWQGQRPSGNANCEPTHIITITPGPKAFGIVKTRIIEGPEFRYER